jgi:hypothetical protein
LIFLLNISHILEFLGSESKFAEPRARPPGAVLCTAAKLVSDPHGTTLSQD